MGNLDHIRFQPLSQDHADDTVVPVGAYNQANLEKNLVHITNNRECFEEQKYRIVETGHKERRNWKNITKRIKRRWDLEFLESKRMAQNLVDNAWILKKGWGGVGRAGGRASYT